MHGTINLWLQSAAWLVMLASWIYIVFKVRQEFKRSNERVEKASREAAEELARLKATQEEARAKSNAMRDKLFAEMRRLGFDVMGPGADGAEEPDGGGN